MIPFNIPAKNRNRVGGVMPPPYESIPPNYNFYKGMAIILLRRNDAGRHPAVLRILTSPVRMKSVLNKRYQDCPIYLW